MTSNELKNLDAGDIVRHVLGESYVIIGKDSKGIPIAVKKIAVSNPSEWLLVVRHKGKDKATIRKVNE